MCCVQAVNIVRLLRRLNSRRGAFHSEKSVSIQQLIFQELHISYCHLQLLDLKGKQFFTPNPPAPQIYLDEIYHAFSKLSLLTSPGKYLRKKKKLGHLFLFFKNRRILNTKTSVTFNFLFSLQQYLQTIARLSGPKSA